MIPNSTQFKAEDIIEAPENDNAQLVELAPKVNYALEVSNYDDRNKADPSLTRDPISLHDSELLLDF
jgi:hypothetical protein